MSNLIKLINTLRTSESGGETEAFSETLQIQLAVAIAMVLDVPVSSIDTNAGTYYSQTHDAKVRKLVSQINELYLIDVSFVTKLIENNYKTRFNLIHRPQEAIGAVVAIANSIIGDVRENTSEITLSESELVRLGLTAGALIRGEEVESE